jgi:hypothetical protein
MQEKCDLQQIYFWLDSLVAWDKVHAASKVFTGTKVSKQRGLNFAAHRGSIRIFEDQGLHQLLAH